ncbi:MAG TPA: DUF4166 domain-containing protein [Phycisphaerae bacterium]|nr:DUF4166 domain-containing protein [Phycisphaerae bacterium]
MKSIYEQAMGREFGKLHPRIRERFGVSSAAGRACVGVGVMERMWRGGPWVWPFLRLGTVRRIMFPETCDGAEFVVENYAYRDPFGRETVTWIRTFDVPGRRRRFDAYMIYSARRGCVVDYLGTHEHLAVDLALSADERGGLRIRSGGQRLYEGCLGFCIPGALAGVAEVCEWFDESVGKFRIRVDVRNERFGRLFGYEGTFDVTWIDAAGAPGELLPVRHECRE